MTSQNTQVGIQLFGISDATQRIDIMSPGVSVIDSECPANGLPVLPGGDANETLTTVRDLTDRGMLDEAVAAAEGVQGADLFIANIFFRAQAPLTPSVISLVGERMARTTDPDRFTDMATLILRRTWQDAHTHAVQTFGLL